jgi:hypothetical protein
MTTDRDHRAVKPNTAFGYMYRDADNYKNSGRPVVFAGPPTPALEDRLRAALEDGEYFIASQIGVPEVFLYDPALQYDPDDPTTYPADLGAGPYAINASDHCWHEFTELRRTADPPTDPRTFAAFVAAVEAAAAEGWRAFTPTKTPVATP